MVLAVVCAVTAIGCGESGSGEAADPQPAVSTDDRGTEAPPSQRYGYTQHRADGSRYALGGGSLDPDADPISVALPQAPSWVVAGRARGENPLVAVATGEGEVLGVKLAPDGPEQMPIAGALSPGQPPLLDAQSGRVVGVDGSSPRSAPTVFDARVLAVGSDGEVLRRGRPAPLARIGALPDSRIAAGARDFAVIAGATDRYDHGALGDELEGSSVVVGQPGGEVANVLRLEDSRVFEGAAPMLTNLGGSEKPEIIATVSDPEGGARLVAYEFAVDSIERSWESEPLGSGNRWRHQIAVAPFGPNGELELASVKTPHLDATVEFHAIDGDELKLRASAPGYSSHQFGSPNLDRAIAGDFDGNGRPELVLPTLDGSALAGIERQGDGAAEVWRLPLPAPLTSNLAAVADQRGKLLLIGGVEDGSLLVWGG